MRVWAGEYKHYVRDGVVLHLDRRLSQGRAEFMARAIAEVGQEVDDVMFVDFKDEGHPIIVGWIKRPDVRTIYQTIIEPLRR